MCVCVVDGFCGDGGGFSCLSSHAGDDAVCGVVEEFFLVAEGFKMKNFLSK